MALVINEETVMKSSLRFNGQELVVENVIPASEEFNKSLYDELIKVFGASFSFTICPVENFSRPDQSESIFQGVISGQFESEAPIAIKVVNNEVEVMTIPAFISFRK